MSAFRCVCVCVCVCVCAFFLASRYWAKLEVQPGGLREDHLLRPRRARADGHNLA